MKENKSLTLKLCQKKDKLKKINTRNINKKLNRKKVLNNCLKSENKELRYELAENLENLKEQATKLQKYIPENGALKKSFVITNQKLESWKLMIKQKKNEYDPSFLLKFEDSKEQVKFLENEKLLLKEQLDNFKNKKIHLFKKGQYSNSTRPA